MGPKRNKRHYYHASRNPQEFLDKKYNFSDYLLNKTIPKDLYVSEKWSLPELQSRKTYLNSVKEQLSDFNLEQWSKHTKWRDPSTTIIHAIRAKVAPELLTQAWCKFYECLSKFNIINNDFSAPTLRSLHLCEAPGGFISALNHYLYEKFPDTKLEWYGNSLNPYYEGTPLKQMIPDDRLISKTLNKWNFGLDLTGDITVFYNHEYLVESTIKKGKMHLVTADGSVDCMLNPGDQEKCVEFLHYCETMTALSVLEKGILKKIESNVDLLVLFVDGSFILKIFTMFEESTVCLLLFLYTMFGKVTIFKPCTSKSGNSELYVICLSYKGISAISNEIWDSLKRPYKAGKFTDSMFFFNDIDPAFMQDIFNCSDLFSKFQTSTIEANIRDFLSERRENVKSRNDDVCRWFENLYRMKTLPNERRLVKDFDVNILRTKNTISSHNLGTHFCFETAFNLIETKIGKKIDIVNNSQFCEQILLANIPFLNNLKKSKLINSLLSILCTNYNIISYSDFQASSNNNYDDFQVSFFRKLHLAIKKNKNDIVLYKVPFLTNFIVSVLYILQSGFDSNLFTNPGIICFNNYNKSNMNNVITNFDLIDKELCDIKSSADQYCFSASLYSILDFTCINKAFLERIWLYNNNLLKSIKNEK